MSSNDLEGEDIWGDVGEAGESKIADAEDLYRRWPKLQQCWSLYSNGEGVGL
jgi:hypothetical protein